MTDLVVSLSAVRVEDAERVGPKAANLGTLLEAGFPVPPGFCITADVFREAMQPYEARVAAVLEGRDLLDAETAERAAHEIAEMLAHLAVPEEIAAQIVSSVETLDEGRPLAVRSSATSEDSAGVSFAGQYETILGVRGAEEVLDALLTCWRSFYSENALVARASAGLGSGEAMAVLVQVVIEPDVAGVAFSLDPVKLDREMAVVNSAWGMGAGVVDGSVATDTFWVHRTYLHVFRTTLVEQAEMMALVDGSLQRVAVPEERRRAASLPRSWANDIAVFALAAEWAFGSPQDVEWAIAGETFWILQSRPITGLPAHLREVPPFPIEWPQPGDERRHWRRWVWLPDPTLLPPPLESDLFELLIEGAREQALFVGQEWEIRWARLNGSVYTTPLQKPLHEGDRRVRGRAMHAMAERLQQTYGMTSWDFWGPEIEAETERLRSFGLAAASPSELAEHYEDTLGALRRHWKLHWFLDPPFNPIFRAHAALTGKDEKERVDEEVLPLLDGEETPMSELIDGLYLLGQCARSEPTVAELVRERPAGVMERLRAMPEAVGFVTELDAFLGRYGDRTGSGFGSDVAFLEPTWADEPERVLVLVAPYLEAGVGHPAEKRARARAERDARVEALCAACEDVEAVAEFRKQLTLARRETAVLEIHNLYIDQMASAHVRRALMEVARRLKTAGAIDDEADVVWFHKLEPADLLRQDPIPPQHEVVAARKADHERWSALIPPTVMGPPTSTLSQRPPLKDEVQERASDPNEIHGQAGSAGTARGRARVVALADPHPHLEPGDVLVSINAGPLWTPYFPHLAAIVLDHGAFGQHACATAREYGIPAVINTWDATARIPDRAWVTVDGTAGTVRIEAEIG